MQATQFFTTLETTKLTGLTYDQLRYLIRSGILRPGKTKNGERFYQDHDLWLIDLIQKLRNRGISLKSIAQTNLPKLVSQKYPSISFLFLNDQIEKSFAAYWNKKQWMVGIGVREIAFLYRMALEESNIIISKTADMEDARRYENT